MKYLFFVHTHITYYISKAIVKELELSENDYFYVKSRNYENRLSAVEGIDISDINKSLNSASYWAVAKRVALVKELDQRISDKIKDEPFKFFVPHVADPAMQAIARHPNCAEINFLEEGANCYSKQFFENAKPSLKETLKYIINKIDIHRKSRYRIQYPLVGFDQDIARRIGKYYTISKKGFNHAKGADIVVLNLIKDKMDYVLNSRSIVIFEAAIENDQIGDQKLYFHAISEMLNSVIANDSLKGIGLKFHPAQSIVVKQRVVDLINQKELSYEIISDDIPFEQILLNFNGLFIYGFTSSLLYYAKILGQNVESFEDMLLEDTIFRQYRKWNDFNLKELLNNS